MKFNESTMKKSTVTFFNVDISSKILILLLSLNYYISGRNGISTQEKVFSRFIWLPQLILSIFLLMSKILSIYCARKSKKADSENKYIFGDIFVLTTVDKLISIGYNIHLIVFMSTRRDIDFAYMIIPLLVFLYYIIDSAVVVFYINTIYYNIEEWQKLILNNWTIGEINTNFIVQNLILMFLFHNYDSLTVHFNRSVYSVQ